LRYDQQADGWQCFDGCGEALAPARSGRTRRRAKRRRRDPLFSGFWLNERGERLGRITRAELREVHRLWAVHADIREGRAA
jgi:hypothetical protein